MGVWDKSPTHSSPTQTAVFVNVPRGEALAQTTAMLNMLNCLPFFSFFSCEKIKSFECPCDIYSASLHPDKSCFVAGGEDFRLFKFDYETGKELGNFIILNSLPSSPKCLHCVSD